ncbi:MFS transporter [Chryseobacterium formosus]|uniref:MFS transporter n=1 Tax=Chryseobacterium formosus TaxID=1537363 RepID=A0ABT3XXJ5_9FLAO|nr:MFS transporter [Chryseobacterium formosus]MCX8526380.1 MFS transporter [Chryseobacterium formosus]
MKTNLNKRIAYIGCLGVVGIISTEFGIIGILPQVAEYYNINIGTAGYLLSAFALLIAITGPFTVLLASKFDKKTIMLYAMVLFFVSNFFSIFSPPFWILMILRILPTVLHPAFFSMVIAAAIKGTSQKYQMKLTAIIIGGIALAQVTLIPLSTFVASIYSWQWTYVIQGFVILLTILIIIRYLPSLPNEQPATFKNQLSILTQPRFISGTLLNILLITAWFCSYSYFADYLSKEKLMNEKEISFLLLLFGAMGILSNYLAGNFLGRKMFWTTLFFVVGVFIVPLGFHYTDNSFLSVVIVTGIWGFMYGPCFLIGVGYMISAAPNAKEFANSLQTSFGNLGVSLGTTVGGLSISQFGISIAPWVGIIFGVLAIFILLWRAYLDRFTKKK